MAIFLIILRKNNRQIDDQLSSTEKPQRAP